MTPTHPGVRQAGAFTLAVTLAFVAGQASAGGFQLNERSAAALGAALAGSASSDRDITFASFNPAALSRVETMELGGNASGILPRTDGRFETGPATGYGFESSQSAFVPAFTGGVRVNDELVIGLASYSPFGLVTSHPNDFPGRADGTTSRLFTVQISPMAAWQPSERFSIGASLDILYLDVTLNSAIASLNGDDIAFGGTIGVHWEPVDGTRIGAAYHSGFDLDTTGRQQNAFLGGATAPLQASASLPGVLSVGVTQQVTEDLAVMGEARLVNWSVFDTLAFESPAFAGTPFAAFEEEQNYDDAFFGSIGAEYAVTNALDVRGGIAFDQTPTNDAFRTVRVPDGDRWWFSAGLSYDLSETMTIDVAYNYLRVFDEPTVTLRNGALAGSEIGYEGDVHIISIGGSVRF